MGVMFERHSITRTLCTYSSLLLLFCAQGLVICNKLLSPFDLYTMTADHFCLKWNNYQLNMVTELDNLRTSEDLVDVTLSCDGQLFKAHKVVLSMCSSYFRNVFKVRLKHFNSFPNKSYMIESFSTQWISVHTFISQLCL